MLTFLIINETAMLQYLSYIISRRTDLGAVNMELIDTNIKWVGLRPVYARFAPVNVAVTRRDGVHLLM